MTQKELTQINISDLSSGTYFIRLTNDTLIEIKKIVVY